ncbi:hypothetical protein [Aquimarina sp. 2201CG14-23]|uniref:hypothetical protein n=1 Tax=Aquimarina mycalae TaxID=3040073 RepID=UPI00247828F3|nr:hypothetical protein [Aquimarina sp. 2201CG14-23]MDH7444036.1 hypothetical protein [Aquimarina sp. 2201CG14-23]
MKKILDLTGVKTLSKGEQRSIKGAMTSITCCGSNRCRISFPGGSFCEPGRCNPWGWGGCILY